MLPSVRDVSAQYNSRISTGILNRALRESVDAHEPPMVHGRRLKFFYTTQAETRPPNLFFFAITRRASIFPTNVLVNKFRESFGWIKRP